MKTVSRQIYLSSNLSSFFRRTGADPAENLRQLDQLLPGQEEAAHEGEKAPAI